MLICSSNPDQNFEKKDVFLVKYGEFFVENIIAFFIKEKKKLIQVDDANDNSWIKIMLFADGYLMTS